MPHNDFNPEKEPTPERKWWNIFERQSEFEHPEREKERQEEKRLERAKELKSATKERGHFWERFFADKDEPDEIKEIAPKGEKVRKKWRALLRRKSEAQVEEFKEKEPETIDSYWLAQLMVAERILTLNERLAETEPKSRERKETKTELDVLGLLSEKLSDPEIKVPAEIEQTYQAIVHVIEAGDGEIEAEDIPVIQETREPEPDEPEQTRSRSFQRYGAAVIVALTAALKKPGAEKYGDEDEEKPKFSPRQPSGAGTYTTGPGPVLPTTPERTPASQPHPTPNVLPHIALTAAVITSEKDVRAEEKREQTPSEMQPQPIHQASVREPEQTIRTETREPLDTKEEVASYLPQKKFEHMSMLELLQIAQTVPIGGGEYLARAYESGKIDRNGLIAVLKTAGRKGNYQLEFKRRSAEYLALSSQPKSPHLSQPSTPPISEPPAQPVLRQSYKKFQPITQVHPYLQKQLTAIANRAQEVSARHAMRVLLIVVLTLLCAWVIFR